MAKCFFFKLGHCQILVNEKCSEKCKFKKTEEEYLAARSRADEILELKGVKRTIVQTEDGPIVTVTKL